MRAAIMRTLGLFFIGLTLNACSLSAPPPPFAGQAHGLKLTIRSTTDLNQYNQRAHVVALYLVQTEKDKPLTAAKGSNEACLKFLDDAMKTEGVLRVEVIDIQPGAKITEYRDLVPNTGWVGVIAAYYNLDAKKCVLAYQLPAAADKAITIDLVLGPAAVLSATKSAGDKK
ncbi:hypothetical protein FACS1894139_18490 [Planctomycetales bacterium]|nr:hypothetical protein FACS1894107_11060 [Planctomycetales bacterium]GHS99479.1 hypothetical protein FACS1894108_09540 [Planctomycetales bacterium]GHT08612.1 hypothetical protein FACS1894139_18490 [Planctomycetales bacterium]